MQPTPAHRDHGLVAHDGPTGRRGSCRDGAADAPRRVRAGDWRPGVTLVAALLASAVPVTGWAQNLRTHVPGVAQPILLDTVAYRARVVAPMARVLAAIDSAYASYNLPAESYDPEIGQLPSRRVTRSRQLGRSAMSRYLDCGRGFSGDNANLYRITLSTAAWPVVVAGDSVDLHVALIAGGQDPAGSRSGYVLCTSKGAFEEEFAGKVKAVLSRTP